jgi:hypothetical protein
MHILAALFFALLAVGYNAAMLLFVAAPRAREAFGEQPAMQPVLLRQLTQRLLGYLPKDVSPVVSLIALLLIFEALPSVLHIVDLINYLHGLANQHEGVLAVLIQGLDMIYYLGTLAAGVCLLGHVRGAVYFALALLLVGFSIIPIALVMQIGNITLHLSTETIIPFLATGVFLITTCAKYVVLAVFLVRYREVRAE